MDKSEMEKEVQKVMDREYWLGYTNGKIDGALYVLFLMDLEKEKRIELLAEAIGLSKETATEFVESHIEKMS